MFRALLVILEICSHHRITIEKLCWKNNECCLDVTTEISFGFCQFSFYTSDNHKQAFRKALIRTRTRDAHLEFSHVYSWPYAVSPQSMDTVRRTQEWTKWTKSLLHTKALWVQPACTQQSDGEEYSLVTFRYIFRLDHTRIWFQINLFMIL